MAETSPCSFAAVSGAKIGGVRGTRCEVGCPDARLGIWSASGAEHGVDCPRPRSPVFQQCHETWLGHADVEHRDVPVIDPTNLVAYPAVRLGSDLSASQGLPTNFFPHSHEKGLSVGLWALWCLRRSWRRENWDPQVSQLNRLPTESTAVSGDISRLWDFL